MFYTIYKVTNKINGKIYIGKHQAKDLNDGYMLAVDYIVSDKKTLPINWLMQS